MTTRDEPDPWLDAVAASSSAAAEADLGDAVLDLDRARRCGYPEVIYAPGKTPEMIQRLANALIQAGQPVLVTRVDPQQAEWLAPRFPGAILHPLARTLRCAARQDEAPPELVGRVSVVTAGAGDLPVAAEAQETLAWMGVAAELLPDIGVAGPQRLLLRLSRLKECDAIVVAAGMEGALPSVVGGFVDCPVIAVPTSVGYGANLAGVSALLSMLNSCAANVAVVNIDAGFKAGFMAGLIARRGHAPRPDSGTSSTSSGRRQ